MTKINLPVTKRGVEEIFDWYGSHVFDEKITLEGTRGQELVVAVFSHPKLAKTNQRNTLILWVKMEARVGIEPAYTELQSAA